MGALRQVDPVELEMASLLAELADPLRLALVAELAGGPASAGQLTEATGRPEGELAPHLAALVAVDVVDILEGGAAAGYRLSDPELGRACAALRSALVCRLATAERLDEFVVASPIRSTRPSRTDDQRGG